MKVFEVVSSCRGFPAVTRIPFKRPGSKRPATILILLLLLLAGWSAPAASSIYVMYIGSSWRVNDTDNLDGSGWTSPGYDDGAWRSGTSTFYWDDPQSIYIPQTELNPGRDTYYFRGWFKGVVPVTNMVVHLNVVADDGAVIYLNGVEVHRLRMPDPPAVISHSTLATGPQSPDGDASYPTRITLTGDALGHLRDGDNLLAVELHQLESPPEDAAFGLSVAFAFNASPPVVLAQPSDMSVVEGRPLIMSILAGGDPRPSIQWFRNGEPIANSTSRYLNIPQVQLGDAGDYHAVLSNALGLATSRVVQVDLEPDLEPPAISIALGKLDLNRLEVDFHQDPLDPDSATSPANYAVHETLNPEVRLTVQEAELITSTRVSLGTSPRREGVNYIVRALNIRDASAAGNVAVSTTAPLYQEVRLVEFEGPGAWRYLAANQPPGTNWVHPDFPDFDWPLGAPLFHGGSARPDLPFPPSTALPLTSAGSRTPISTHYFRTTFDLPGPYLPYSLQYRCILDDGMVIYLNGSRLHQLNVPLDPGHETPALLNVGTASIDQPFRAYSVPSLKDRGNLLTVELHQHPDGLDDATLGIELTAVVTNLVARPLIEIPEEAMEGDGLLASQGIVRFADPVPKALRLSLSTTDPVLVSVPSEIEVPAGTAQVPFSVFIGDDSLLRGPRTIWVRAESEGLPSSERPIRLMDDETGSVRIQAPAILTEGHGAFTATIVFDASADEDIAIRLSSTGAGELSHPSLVIMPAGQTSMEFEAVLPDNDLIDGNRGIMLAAEVTGWLQQSHELQVMDDEARTLELLLGASLIEGRSDTGTLELGGRVLVDLSVELSTDTPGQLDLPASLVVPAGSDSIEFEFTATDDLVPETALSVQVTAQGGGFSNADAWVTILDDDPARLMFESIDSPQRVNEPFLISVVALDMAGNVQTNFQSTVQLIAEGLETTPGISPAALGPFEQGRRSAYVTIQEPDRVVRLSANSLAGESNPFRVERAPWTPIDLPTMDLAWDAVRETLYATVPAGQGPFGGQLVAIDPASGQITNAYIVAPNPGRMDIPENGSSLYLSVSNRLALQRFDLPTRRAISPFSLGASAHRPYEVADFEVLEGTVDGVVARLIESGSSASGIWRFVSGVPAFLDQFAPPTPIPYQLEAASGGLTIYGYQNNNAFSLMRSDAYPGAPLMLTNGIFNKVFDESDWSGTLVLREGFLYNGLGRSIRAEDFSLFMDYPGVREKSTWSAFPETDPDRNRVLYLTGRRQASSGFYKIKAYDRTRGNFLGELTLPILSGEPGRFLRMGTNGLAFNAPGRVWLIRSELLQPTGQEVDLQLSQSATPDPQHAFDSFEMVYSLTNAGTSFATFIHVTNSLPRGLMGEDARASQGIVQQTAQGLSWQLDQLEPGGVATLSISARFEMAGWFTNTATVTSYEGDRHLEDNRSIAAYEILLPEDPVGLLEVVNTGAVDLIYNPVTDTLLLARENQLIEVDPYTGRRGRTSTLPAGITRLLPSADRASAYLGLRESGTIRRIDLSDHSVMQDFDLGSVTKAGLTVKLYPGDMVELEAAAGTLAVARRFLPTSLSLEGAEGLAIYDAGQVRPLVESHQGDWRLELDPDRGQLLGLNRTIKFVGTAFQLSRFNVESDGLRLVEHYPVLYEWMGTDIEMSGSRLLSDRGRELRFDPFQVTRIHGGDQSVLVEPEPERNAFWLLALEESRNGTIQLIDHASGVVLSKLEVSDVQGEPRNLIRWGTDGLAFHTTAGQLFVGRTELRAPGATSDLDVQLQVPEGVVAPDSEVLVRVSVRNNGPGPARSVDVSQAVGPPLEILDSSCSAGLCDLINGSVEWSLDEVAVGQVVEWELLLRSSTNGIARIEASVSGRFTDVDPSNNGALAFLNCTDAAGFGHRVLSLPADGMAWSEARQELLVQSSASPRGDALVGLDPVSLSAALLHILPDSPGPMAVSPTGGRLHVARGPHLHTFSLPALELTGNRAISTNGVLLGSLDLEVVPEDPDSVLLARNNNSMVLIQGERAVMETADLPPHEVEFAGASSPVFGLRQSYTGHVSSHTIHQLESGNLSFLGTHDPFNWTATAVSLEWAGDRMVTSSGDVFDPHRQYPLGRIPGIPDGSPLRYDPGSDRILFLIQQGEEAVIRAYHPPTLLPIGSHPLPSFAGQAMDLVRWGATGLAFRTTAGELHLLETSLLPGGSPIDLSLQLTSDVGIAQVGIPVSFGLTMTGPAGGWPGEIRVGVALSDSLTIGLAGPGRLEEISPGRAIIHLAPSAQSITHQTAVTVVPTRPGQLLVDAVLVSGSTDPDLENNSASLRQPVSIHLGPDQSTVVSMPVADLLWDEGNQSLVISGAPDHLALLDPYQGAISTQWPLPEPVSRMALSANGTKLHAAAANRPQVLRLATNSGEVETVVRIADAGDITDLAASPGREQAFLAAVDVDYSRSILAHYAGEPGGMHQRVLGGGAEHWIEFGQQPDRAFLLTKPRALPPRLEMIRLNPDGGILEDEWAPLPYGTTPFTHDDGVLFSGDGKALRPEDGEILGSFDGISDLAVVAPETERGRVYFVTESETGWQLQAHDPLTRQRISSLALPLLQGQPIRLLRWGEDGLAIGTTSNQVFLIRSSLVPSGSPVDLVVHQSSSVPVAALGEDVTYTLSITNLGPGTAMSPVLLNAFPAHATLLHWSAPGASGTAFPDYLRLEWPSLESGAVLHAELTVRVNGLGLSENVAIVTAATTDSSLANNRSRQILPVAAQLRPNQPVDLGLQVIDVAYDPVSARLFAAIDTSGLVEDGHIAIVHPATGAVEDWFNVEPGLQRIVLSDDGSTLHAITGDGRRLVQVHLPDHSIASRAEFGSSGHGEDSLGVDLTPIPGIPDSIIAVLVHLPGIPDRYAAFRYTRGIEQPESIDEVRQLVFYAESMALATENQWNGPVRRISLQPGLTLEASTGSMDLGQMSPHGGLLFGSRGLVMDPVSLTVVRELDVRGDAIAVDGEAARVAVAETGGQGIRIVVTDTLGLAEWGRLELPQANGSPLRLLRCGEDRLALLTTAGQLYLLRSTAFGLLPGGDLSVGIVLQPPAPTAGVPYNVELVVTNHSTLEAGFSRAIQSLPPGTEVLTTSATGPTVHLPDLDLLYWDLYKLEAGGVRTNRVGLLSPDGGSFPLKTRLRSILQDSDPSDDVRQVIWQISP